MPKGYGAWLELVVTHLALIAPGVLRLDLASRYGSALPGYSPGAHLTLHLAPGLERSYSLVRPFEGGGDTYTVCVKDEGRPGGGSDYIHTRLTQGSPVRARPPANFFPLDEQAAQSLLIAGGIGITPVLCMAARLEVLGRSWELHFFAPGADEAPLLDEVLALGDCAKFHATRGRPRPDIAGLVAATDAHAHLYCCGPGSMLEAFRAATRSRPASNVHVESFSAAAASNAATDSEAFQVVLARSRREIVVPAAVSILEALRASGIDAPSSCRQGVCGACETRVISGEPDHRDVLLSDAEKASNETMLICCSRSRSRTLVLDL